MAEFENENIVDMDENDIDLLPEMAGRFILNARESKRIRGIEYDPNLELSRQYNVCVQPGHLYRLYMTMTESFVLICQTGEENRGELVWVIVYAIQSTEFNIALAPGDYFNLIVPMGRRITLNANTPHFPAVPQNFDFEVGEVKNLIVRTGSAYLIRGILNDEPRFICPAEVVVSFEAVPLVPPATNRTRVNDTFTINLGVTYFCALRVNHQQRIFPSVGERTEPFIVNVKVGQLYLLYTEASGNCLLRAFGNIEDQQTANVSVACTNEQTHTVLASPSQEKYVIIQDIHKQINVRREEQAQLSNEDLIPVLVTVYPGRITHVNARLGYRYVVVLDLQHIESPKIVNPGQVHITAHA